ncbi:MAG: methionyl-tRNA formyltransferase [Candidatus Zixiibacteriota bacterium]|nr:MAG: methionyl-tRNA formyltransferase [candidate division Zixibacteria bacterium]
MKIVFMGTPAFACPPLEALHQSTHEVLAVVTGPDKPAGRGKKLTPSEVSQLADRLGCETLKPVSLKDDAFQRRIEAMQPDLIVVVAFRILPKKLFSLPKHGSINIHASLLPRYRGAAPINWALINGETETGLTSFRLKSKVDTGDIILQEKAVIDPDDRYDTLYERLSRLAGPFLLRTIDIIESGRHAPAPQDESQASAAPKIGPFDALIDFGFPAEKVRNFIRGLSSKPGAYTSFRGRKLKILSCRLSPQQGPPGTRPGSIINTKKILLVQCAESAIELTSLIPEGKKQMDGSSFINGFKPQPGEILGKKGS